VCSKWLKLTPKSGIFRKLPFEKWKHCRKDQPRISKDLIFFAYWRCKIKMKVERECLTNLLTARFIIYPWFFFLTARPWAERGS